ncbi:MAG: hypothetical protein D3923_15420, partial [Candidatus Electrothrix sp. AR3]|nr:hypothetical protein [Candidatus Electrothrix sp. AR3]
LIHDGFDSTLESGTPLQQAVAAAERLSCNAVLEISLSRYKERVGGKYTAKEPASVAFNYRLLAMPEGTALCRGSFDQEQQSLLANLLHFKAGAEHGFTWITADQLLSQGVKNRLDECSYLVKEK